MTGDDLPGCPMVVVLVVSLVVLAAGAVFGLVGLLRALGGLFFG